MTVSPVRRTRREAPSLWRRLLWIALFLVVLLGVAAVAAVAVALDRVGRTPREWAPYLEHRSFHHNAVISDGAELVAEWLRYADGLPHGGLDPSAWAGALVGRASVAREPASVSQHLLVGSAGRLREAVSGAHAGDVIELLPGTYRMDDPPLYFDAHGSAAAPIVVRASRLGDVTIEANTQEAFKVRAPYWTFENLQMRGVCGDDSYCEHAFHVVGAAEHIVIRNNRLTDFNAQIKINAEDGRNPDAGLIEFNTFSDTRPRKTENPVTPIDLDTASGWHVAGNLITDFIKGAGNGTSYGAFAKAAGDHTVFERNVVLCEQRLNGYVGARIGLSFGGGGSPGSIRRDGGTSGHEQTASVMRDNLIAFCSDDGIYLNRAAESVIDHNTLIDTAGVDVRFPESSAEIVDNIVDGAIRERDGGSLQAAGNIGSPLLGLFVGWHPARGLFNDPARLDLTWRSAPAAQPARPGGTDLCGVARGALTPPGAFADFVPCLHGAASQ